MEAEYEINMPALLTERGQIGRTLSAFRISTVESIWMSQLRAFFWLHDGFLCCRPKD
jgi:hypothetical protein